MAVIAVAVAVIAMVGWQASQASRDASDNSLHSLVRQDAGADVTTPLLLWNGRIADESATVQNTSSTVVTISSVRSASKSVHVTNWQVLTDAQADQRGIGFVWKPFEPSPAPSVPGGQRRVIYVELASDNPNDVVTVDGLIISYRQGGASGSVNAGVRLTVGPNRSGPAPTL